MPITSLPRELRTAGRFLGGLHQFLAAPPLTGADDILRTSLAERSSGWVSLLDRSVFANPRSPYRQLLRHAGVERGDLVRLIEREGVEGSLGALHAAGVHLSLDEFKGRRPIRRGSFSLDVQPSSFDNPLLSRYFEATTGGSRSPGARVINDLRLVEHEAAYDTVVMRSLPIQDRPLAIWRPVPPGSAGLKICLRFARIGRPVSQWFSQIPPVRLSDWRHSALLQAVLLVSRRSPGALPAPVHVPPLQAERVARWLAARVAEGRAAFFDSNAASSVRVCLAARDGGLDISGTFFRTGGEPLSPGKIAVFSAAGCQAACHYSLAEVGRLGHACGNPETADEVHVATDKVALLERPVSRGPGEPLPGLFVTSLLPHAPKILLNVELGDYAVRSARPCGCAWEALGFTDHLHTIRSYEKLTTDGMHFVGADLLDLVERVLPSRFGGDATDYQFVEEEEGGLTRVSLVVSPRVPLREPAELVRTVLDELGSHGRGNRMMATIWQNGGTLQVVRRDPHVTRVGKIHALHVPQPGRSDR